MAAVPAEGEAMLDQNEGQVVLEKEKKPKGWLERKFKAFKKWFKPSHKCCKITDLKRVMLVRKSILFLLDLITDIIFTVSLFIDGSWKLGIVSVVFLIGSMCIGNKMLSDGVSFQYTTDWFKKGWGLRVLEFLQLKPMLYPIGLLTHKCRRMWIVERYIARYCYVKYIERMLENTPEMILQVYVLAHKAFKGEGTPFTNLNFTKVSNIFSLLLSIMMLPSAIIEYEKTSRSKDIESNDFIQYKLTHLFPWLNQHSLMACKLYKGLAEITLSPQTFVKHLVYMACLISRLVFFSLFFLALGAVELKIGKDEYDVGPYVQVVAILLLFFYRFMYYFFTLRAPRTKRRSCALISLFHIFTATCNHFIIPNKDLNYRANKIIARNEATVKNDRGEDEIEVRKVYEVTVKELIQLVFMQHLFSLVEWAALAVLIEVYLKEKMIASYEKMKDRPEMPKYISMVTAGAIGLYVLAVLLYCVYWRFWHPDRIGGKVTWKRLQLKKFKDIKRPVIDRSDPDYQRLQFMQFKKEKLIKDYELKLMGVGLFIDCDYKEKEKGLTPEQKVEKKKRDKKQKKEDGCMSGCFKCLVYDEGVDAFDDLDGLQRAVGSGLKLHEN